MMAVVAVLVVDGSLVGCVAIGIGGGGLRAATSIPHRFLWIP
jgi:hypothetical protein